MEMKDRRLHYDDRVATFMETLTEGKIGYDWCVLFKKACEDSGMGDPQEILDALLDIRLGNHKLHEEAFNREMDNG